MNLKAKFTKTSAKPNPQEAQVLNRLLIATIAAVFCLVFAKALMSQVAYQAKVINARHKSTQQIKKNIASANTLVTQYKDVFIGKSAENIIGGTNDPNPTAAPPNGDNGRVVLDALPTIYDFPALLTSMSKILATDGIGNQSIGGTDQSSTSNSDPSVSPQPVNIDLSVSGTGTYKDAARLVRDLEHSIRPFDVTHLTLTGNESSLTINLNLSTYYQPAKTLGITSKEIK